jgi:O-antigen/teichoic acid export membrane protein
LVVGLVARQVPVQLQWDLVSPLIRVGWPSVIGVAAFFIVDYADRLILKELAGTQAVGLYSVGYSFGMVMILAVNAFGAAWPPYYLSFAKKRDEAQVVFGRVMKYYLAVFGFVALLFFAGAKPVITLMTAPGFHPAHTVVGIIAISYAMKGAFLIVLPGIVFEEKLHLQALVEWVAAGVNLGFNLLLIREYGFPGAAWATLISYTALLTLGYAVSRKYLAVQYDWGRIGVLLAAICLGCSALYFSSMQFSISVHSSVAIGILATFFIIVMTVVVGRDERSLIFSSMRQAIRPC